MSLFHNDPSTSSYSMQARVNISKKRVWLRQIVREWRRFVVLQLEIRLHTKMVARVCVYVCPVVCVCLHFVTLSCVSVCLRS